jgi:DNA-binding MarR family transcriptional regulator
MNTSLTTVLDLVRARTVVARQVDHSLGSFHGLGLNDLALLLELRGAPEGRLRRVELAERLGITTSGVARQLQPLEKRGLVDREPSPGDARLALVVLTESGIRVADEALPSAEYAAQKALDALWTDDQSTQLGELLQNASSRPQPAVRS